MNLYINQKLRYNFDKQNQGVFVILEGKCIVINRKDNQNLNQDKKSKIKSLKLAKSLQSKVCDLLPGDAFGYGQAMGTVVGPSRKNIKIHDCSDYGDIFALNDVKCIYIPHSEFVKIPNDELSAAQELLSQQNMNLEYRLCQKYKIPFSKFV